MRPMTTTTEGTGSRIRRRATVVALASGRRDRPGRALLRARAGILELHGPARPTCRRAPTPTSTSRSSSPRVRRRQEPDDRAAARPGRQPAGGAAICSDTNLAADTCPADSDVGNVVTNASVLSLPLPIDIPGDLYNITPADRRARPLRDRAAPGRRAAAQGRARVRRRAAPERPRPDTVIEDIPNTSSGLPIDINSMTVGLAGTAGPRRRASSATRPRASPKRRPCPRPPTPTRTPR